MNKLPQVTRAALGTVVTLIDGEDCEEAIGEALPHQRAILTIVVIGLTLNVIAPANVSPSSKLPVVVVCFM